MASSSKGAKPFIPPRGKGATLSDVSAAREYGLSRNVLHQAMSTGKLHYQIASMHGNPWFRLVRSEVVALAAKQLGSAGLKRQQAQTKIVKARTEIRQLQRRIKLLSQQVEEWERHA